MRTKFEDYDILGVGVADCDVTTKISTPWMKIRRKIDGQLFMWKELSYESLSVKDKQNLLSEINYVQHIKHDYILSCYECIDNLTACTLGIVTEYCENGTVKSLISKCRNDSTFLHGNFMWKILYQSLKVLENIQFEKLNDIALYHHMLTTSLYLDSKWNIKFSLLDAILDRYFCFNSFAGTPCYVSPEQINKNMNIAKCNIWSLGCLIYELCALVPPYSAANWSQLLTKINCGSLKRIPCVYSDELQSIINEMLTTELDQRPSFGRLLSNPIFAPFHSKAKKRDPAFASLDIHLQQKLNGFTEKEKSLTQREKDLKERQIEIEESERKLNIKMKHIEEQLERAEKLVGHLNKNKSFSSAPELINAVDPPPLPIKKKVHFKFEEPEKENCGLSMNVPTAQAQADFAKSRKELESRLQRAHIRALEIRNQEIQSRQADKIMHFPR